MGDIATLDTIILVVLAIAIARGFWIGLIREGFSIAALGGGLLAVRYGLEPLAGVVERASGGDFGPTASSWIAGIAIGLATVAIIGIAGKLLRRGAHAVGLGWADRVAGGVIGGAEGALAAGVILVVALWTAGPDSSMVEDSKSMELLDDLQEYLAEHRDELPAVAAPPDWLPLDRLKRDAPAE
jgi:membrane protein required for colicin V production